MTAVDSAAIAEIGYAQDERALLVRFRSGEAYAYMDVPPETYRKFMEAPSKGAFFHEEIDPVFRYLRLRAP